MKINNTLFNAELMEILVELKSQLNMNGINLLKDIKDGPDNIQVTCIYHNNGQERKPSAGIRKSDGIYHCFACQETHELQEFISHCFGRNDCGVFGWNWLLKNFLTVSVEDRQSIPIDLDRNMLYNVSKDKQYVSEEELSNYRYIHPYMYKRRLTDEIIEIFDIGYDKDTRCITFPVRDISGRTLFIARRSVNTKYFNYPQNVDKPVYGLYEYFDNKDKVVEVFNDKIDFRNDFDSSTIIICESMIDCLTCWVYGKYAVALNGLGTEYQFEQLNKMPCRKFILATDMDEAGQKARKRIRANIKNKIVTEYIWDINVAKDINEMTEEYFNNLQEVF